MTKLPERERITVGDTIEGSIAPLYWVHNARCTSKRIHTAVYGHRRWPREVELMAQDIQSANLDGIKAQSHLSLQYCPSTVKRWNRGVKSGARQLGVRAWQESYLCWTRERDTAGQEETTLVAATVDLGGNVESRVAKVKWLLATDNLVE